MLEVQKFLIKHKNFEELNKQFGIKINFHPVDDRVILNYCQIESSGHKEHPIVRECRGLVLNSKDYSLIARAFPRFYNLNEVETEFDWSDYVCQEKADGSLILVYWWNDAWHVNTRNSFGSANVGSSMFSWRDLVFYGLPFFWKSKLDKRYTYVFELCSPYNQVVKHHPETHLKLLSVFEQENELGVKETKDLADRYLLDFIKHYCVQGKAIERVLENLEEDDPTNEGVVLRDKNNNRIKVKTKSYLRLHKVFNNGNLGSVKNLVPVVLTNEIDELLVYWPHLKIEVENIKDRLSQFRKSIDDYWFVWKDEPSRKKFALAVKDHPFSSLLFKAKDTGEDPVKLFDRSPELIIKVLTNGNCLKSLI